ncbi:acyl-CoA dehydrogenase [Streptomyces sp. WZ.A104]|uniref:Acyl-CoA dehydrogenase family protein n=1 Tax=Streptomyces durocortorensis TaxID=2811104 RepID=A0ABY9VXD5_9ACTN|nr:MULTISPECIES: acyl-CoA dehydrogenase family protein [Streptomyces]PCG82040.1 acyl-CoA dehydrogenase [Streptomyces sp. WZ.A104]WNF28378.1 acyl-CoA dehydrogenase family protein [Streptomyces durocortorensis]
MRTWDEEQLALREGMELWCRDLADVEPGTAETGLPPEAWKLVRSSGVLGLPFDPARGGAGVDLLTTMFVLEALGKGCRDGGLSFSVATTLCSTGVPLQHFGTDEQKDRYLTRLCSGDLIGAHAISEPDTGSDALSMRTNAVRDGDHFVLNGTKSFVTNGPVADVVVVYACTRPGGGPLGITAFLVDTDTPGFSAGRPLKKMGLTSSPMSELYFDDCRVPADRAIGGIGRGYLLLEHVMKWEILCSFIINVGEMQHRFDRCLEYARTRTQFGKPIGSYQAISHKLVDMRIRLETARRWLYDTAERLVAGEDVTMDVAISKLLTSEANVASGLAAIQVFGGNGYMSEYGLDRELANAVGSTLYSGTTEIQYNRISSLLGM